MLTISSTVTKQNVDLYSKRSLLGLASFYETDEKDPLANLANAENYVWLGLLAVLSDRGFRLSNQHPVLATLGFLEPDASLVFTAAELENQGDGDGI